jgi:hypothetical protein
MEEKTTFDPESDQDLYGDIFGTDESAPDATQQEANDAE